MRWRPAYDPRESPKHRALLTTRSTLAYLPVALRWALSPAVWSMALVYGFVIGVFGGTLTGMWLVTLASCGVIAWLLAVQARAVFGFGDPPQLTTADAISVGRGAILVMLMVAVLLAGYGALRAVDPVLARTGAWIVGAMVPSMFVLLAVEDSLFAAFAPHRVLRVLLFGGPLGWLLAALCGWGSAVMLELLAQMVGQPETVVALVAPTITGAKIGVSILALWSLAVLLHLNGHALHHRHVAAGLGAVLEAAGADELEERRTEEAVKARYATIERLQAAKDAVGLERVCAQPVAAGLDPLRFNEMLWRELLFHRHYAAAVKVSNPLLTAAVAAKRYPLAKEVWLEVTRRSPSFDPGSELRARFLELAEANRDREMVARLA